MPQHTTIDADTVEAVAQRLYRQHRARDGFPEYHGEWDRAGSHQAQFRADARDLLAAADLTQHVNQAVTTRLNQVAETIERELICCDVFERLSATPSETWTEDDRTAYRTHSICYWAAAARALVLDATTD